MRKEETNRSSESDYKRVVGKKRHRRNVFLQMREEWGKEKEKREERKKYEHL